MIITVKYCIALKTAGRFGGGNVWQPKTVWLINRSAEMLLIVSTNLDGLSLVNHGWSAKIPP